MMLQRRQVFSVLLGTALLLLMLVLASLGGSTRKAESEEILVRREVQMYVPPPPPPPAQTRQQSGGGGGQPLAIVSGNSEVKLEIMELDVDAPVSTIGMGGTGSGGGSGSGLGLGFGSGVGEGIDWGTVAIADLDGLPTVVSSPPYYPGQLVRRGIYEFSVKFHIMIDEEGYTWPISIVENSYPELNEELMEFASKVRFTPPTRLGIGVKTEYLWPVVFHAAQR
jgi:hypothetical protein